MKAKRDIRLLASGECQAVIAVPNFASCLYRSQPETLAARCGRKKSKLCLRILFGVCMARDRNAGA
jgi:hypothetical protein